jgi:hypothetical protein
VVTLSVGSVTVFTRIGSTWTQQQKLYASNFARSDNFGSGLALRGNHLLVGSPTAKVGQSLSRGSVYWFQRNGTAWTQKANFLSNVGNDNQQFGGSIAIDSLGQTAVIGASTLVESASGLGYAGAGRVFVFTFNGNGWSQQAALQTPGSMAGPWMRFGSAVAIHGNSLVIGAPGVDLPGVSDPFGSKGGVGRCHIFTRSGTTWTHQAALEPLNGNQGTAFGRALELSGNTAVIATSGSVELFTRSGTVWTRENELHSSIAPGNASFGRGLALDGDLLAVGTPSMDRVIEPIKRSYSGLGGVELFRISANSTTVAITHPAADPVALADTSLSLRFSAIIDTRSVAGTPVVAWSKLSGPGGVSFSNATATDTTATFSTAGTYVVQCAVTHAGHTATSSRIVVVATPAVVTFRQGVNAYRQETTMVREDYPSWNIGAADHFLVGSAAPSKKQRGLLSFDLIGLPTSAIIHEISLETTTSSTAGTGTVSQLELRLLPTLFTEGSGSGPGGDPSPFNYDSGANWTRRSDFAGNLNWGSPGHLGTTVLSTLPGFNAQSESDTAMTFGSTPEFVTAAQVAIPAGRLNLVIRAPDSEAGGGDNSARFYSDDAANPAVRPQLRITYSAGQAPQIATTSLTTLVAQATSLRGFVTGATSLAWTIVSGPGTATFSDPASPRATVAFDQPGSYVLKVNAGNNTGEVGGNIQVQVEAPNPAVFAEWQQQTWPGVSNPERIAPHRDPDGDGIINFLEWALHLDATKPDTAQIALEIQGELIEYCYTRRIAASGEAVFQVVWSDDLGGTWSSAGVGEESITPLTETSEAVRVSIPGGTHGRCFVRLGVTQL